MGKVHCEACKKTCKGQAIRLRDKYYHLKCFQCKECKKQLSSGGFYSQNENCYCAEDYRKLFGTKCAACGQYVEGEVVTALGNTYHQTCFHCNNCDKTFGPGDKVTFTGKDFVCMTCLEENVSQQKNILPPQHTPITKVTSQPVASSTPAPRTQHAQGVELASPLSEPSTDISSEKGKMTNGMSKNRKKAKVSSPVSATSGYKSDPDTDRVQRVQSHSRADSRGSSVFEESAISPTIFTHNGRQHLSPMQNFDSTTSLGSKKTLDFGRFYNQSYLDKTKGHFQKGPSINPSNPRSPHFHRPENFSYKGTRDDLQVLNKPLRKESQSMMSALADHARVRPKKLEDFIDDPALDKKELVKQSTYPCCLPTDETKPAPIEREDWPAPPLLSAAFPELLYKGRKRSAGGSTGNNVTITIEDEEEENVPPDPRVERDIQMLSKLPNSGAAKAFLHELKKRKRARPVPLDPISASRTPGADKEPHFRTRYESHVFASPSRDLEYHITRPRMYSMDDQMVGLKYRSMLQSVGNFPVTKPGYTLRAARTANMPATIASLRVGGYFSDIEHCTTRDSDFDDLDRSGMERERKHLDFDHHSHSINTSQSSLEEFDPVTGLRLHHGSRFRASSSSFSKSPFRKSAANLPEEPTQTYSYDVLLRKQLPIGVDRDHLEMYLNKADFHRLFNLSQDEFYRLAEWKQSDLKRRKGLY